MLALQEFSRSCVLTGLGGAPTLWGYLSEGNLPRFARGLLLALLVAGLAAVPARAGNEKPLGMVIQAEVAHLDNARAVVGATVYPGDALATEPGGSLRLKLGSGQLYLLGSTTATLAQNPTAVHAVVNRGTVGFSSSATDPLELETPLGIVRASSGSGYGQVTLTGPREMIVSAYRGDLIVDYNGELHTIPEGKSVRVEKELDQPAQPEPAAAPPQEPQGSETQKQALNTKTVEKVAAVAVVALVTWAIYEELCESSSKFEDCHH